MLEREYNKIKSSLESLDKIYRETRRRYDITDIRLRCIDDELMDIRHIIELEKLSACKMTLLYKRQQALLKLRREYKDYKMVAIHLLTGLNQARVQTSLKNTRDSYSGLGRRQYENRAKENIKDSLTKEMINEGLLKEMT